MAWTEQDYQEIVARLKTESQGVGDVPNAETLTGISSLPAYQEKDGEDIIVRAPLELLAAPALEAADKANAAATKAESNATAAQTAANSANEKAGLAAQAASDAEEKATAANTAAQDAEKVANNPTYIGKDHYVYVYNKDTESFDKTDIYCKGEPGSSFRVSGEYATLEALKSAVPDGSAVDGFMAVGTEAPYDYYAWVNGEWVSQGKIGDIEEAPTDGKAYGRKNGDWAEVPEKSDVLTKTNSESFTPTSDYQPATKKYADNINYGKVINVSEGTYLATNKNERDREAIDLINAIFGSVDNLKEIIQDIIENHTKYYFHSYNSKDNCIELSSIYSFHHPKTDEYNLQCNISYYTNNGPVSKRMGFKLMPNDEDCAASIEDILSSDNLQRVVKRTKPEYDSIGTKDNSTMYAVIE